MSAIPGGGIGFDVLIQTEQAKRATAEVTQRVKRMADETKRIKADVPVRIDTKRVQAEAETTKRIVRDMTRDIERSGAAANRAFNMRFLPAGGAGGGVSPGALAAAKGGGAGAAAAAAGAAGAAGRGGLGITGDAGLVAALRGTGIYLAVRMLGDAMNKSSDMAERYDERLKDGAGKLHAFTASVLEGIPVVKNLSDGMQSVLDIITGERRGKKGQREEDERGIAADKVLDAAFDRRKEAERERRILNAGRRDPLFDAAPGIDPNRPGVTKEELQFRQRREEARVKAERDEERIAAQALNLPKMTGDEAAKFAEAQRQERLASTNKLNAELAKIDEEEAQWRREAALERRAKVDKETEETAKEMERQTQEQEKGHADAFEGMAREAEEERRRAADVRDVEFEASQTRLETSGQGRRARLEAIKERMRLETEATQDPAMKAAIADRAKAQLEALLDEGKGGKGVTAEASSSASLRSLSGGDKAQDKVEKVLKGDILTTLQNIEKKVGPALTS